MKNFILLFAFVVSAHFLYAQKNGVTDTGEEIILYSDGTWKYQNEEDSWGKEIPTNTEKFIKGDQSTYLLKSNMLNVGFWLNPEIWTYNESTTNPAAEYVLKLKGEELYGMVISEKVEIPLDILKSKALQNGKSVTPDLHIVKEEYRYVNDQKVLLLQMNGTMVGVKFTYYGYYFSNSNGTVQFITYTSQNLFNKYENECETLMNGLVALD